MVRYGFNPPRMKDIGKILNQQRANYNKMSPHEKEVMEFYGSTPSIANTKGVDTTGLDDFF